MVEDSIGDMLKAVDLFDFQIIIITLKLLAVFLILSLIKGIVDNIVAYISFRSNPFVSLDKNVIVDEFEGEITRITFGQIYIKNQETGFYLIVNMSTWRERKWVFANN